jgi:DNA-binding cell septation regulator SpoVG
MTKKEEVRKMKEIVISEIQVIPVKPKDGLVAFASCVIDSQFYVGDIAIYTRPNGRDYRLVYPSKTLPNGKRINSFHPIRREAADKVTQAIVTVFRNLTEKVMNTKGKSDSESRSKG